MTPGTIVVLQSPNYPPDYRGGVWVVVGKTGAGRYYLIRRPYSVGTDIEVRDDAVTKATTLDLMLNGVELNDVEDTTFCTIIVDRHTYVCWQCLKTLYIEEPCHHNYYCNECENLWSDDERCDCDADD